jgi:hypothetical protein
LEFTSPFAANSPLFFARGRLFWLFWGAKGNLKRPKKSQNKILLAAELKHAYGSIWEGRLRKKAPDAHKKRREFATKRKRAPIAGLPIASSPH